METLDDKRVYACTHCGYLWAVPAVCCPMCDSVSLTTLPPPIAPPAPSGPAKGRILGFSPLAVD